ncbi:probable ribonuclease ZC3H12C isoform X4 [Phymastichus coffea]|uniref:probable ribonuclease ZC3H12C isoform X4 n=1 Tax=Phymastichus coffea TaxID=108790 RepID=UPI00273B1503|nr:probable ribonuclease ZC3H12C isoform X4 [Phymastichus coffea]
MTITGKKYVDCALLQGGGGSAEAAEDSSYDSDYEAEDNNVNQQVKQHSKVSRTASDTLAAEFAEYVSVHTNANLSQTPGYTARVEFALKLGYTERLVQAALQKLGPDPGQNELLAELIKLGANTAPKLADTAEDGEVVLPDCDSSTSSSSCQDETATEIGLRPVVIDGSNVAMSHGNKEVFSCRGIKICVDWFRARGHREITVFVPKWRKESSRLDNPIADQEILGELERDRLLVFTPSRLVGGKRMVCYDDRYILRLAAELDGIVVSNDNYRDLAQESPEFRKVVEERILMYSFVNDRFMPPDDPLGRSGPILDHFLRIGPKRTEPAPPCPYAKKCTYGNKCKFRHPERGPHPHKSVTERLVEHAQRHLQARGPSLSVPLSVNTQHSSLVKTKSCDVTKSNSAENYAQTTYNASSLGWTAPRVQNAEPEPANMHRKLQRQLTLNPSCDLRLNQLRSWEQPHHHQHHRQQHHTSQPQPHPQHQHVTRIASAPDSYRPWPINTNQQQHPSASSSSSHQRLGASDSQLNLQWDARRHLHYHLSSIFPEEQVQAAMALNPRETDPQKICAAILAMFPNA